MFSECLVTAMGVFNWWDDASDQTSELRAKYPWQTKYCIKDSGR